MGYPAIVAASLGSTAFFALATALKHRSAGHAPRVSRFTPAQLGAFVVATARHPLWLAGLLADAGGLVLQVLALRLGPLSVVQPLLVSAVLFSLLISHWVAGTRVSKREIGLGLLLVVAVGGFLLVSQAVTVANEAQAADRAPAAVLAGIALVVIGGCVTVSRRVTPGRAALLLGVAVGMTYAVTAALIKSCTYLVQHGVLGLLAHWQPYGLVVGGAAGLLLAQLAFQAGPLRRSLPATATTDPLASVAIGVLVYDERLNSSPGAIVLQLLALGLMAVVVVALSRVRISTDELAGTANSPHGAPAPGSV